MLNFNYFEYFCVSTLNIKKFLLTLTKVFTFESVFTCINLLLVIFRKSQNLKLEGNLYCISKIGLLFSNNLKFSVAQYNKSFISYLAAKCETAKVVLVHAVIQGPRIILSCDLPCTVPYSCLHSADR